MRRVMSYKSGKERVGTVIVILIVIVVVVVALYV